MADSQAGENCNKNRQTQILKSRLINTGIRRGPSLSKFDDSGTCLQKNRIMHAVASSCYG